MPRQKFEYRPKQKHTSARPHKPLDPYPGTTFDPVQFKDGIPYCSKCNAKTIDKISSGPAFELMRKGQLAAICSGCFNSR